MSTLETPLKSQEHEDERILNIVLKAHRLSVSMMEQKVEQKAYASSLDIARSTRDVPPAHFTLKIKSFSQLLQILSDSGTENYESNIFEASGYNWKLCLYPNGYKEKNAEGHISLYLVIAETESLPVGWEVKVNFNMFVFDQVHGTYTIFQDNDGKLHNFNKSETQFGFAKLLPINVFKDPKYGFLIRDKCMFGVEVFVWNNSGRGECLSVKQEVGATHTWRIDNFSSFQNDFHRSDDFTLGNRTWMIKIYPKGEGTTKGEYVSLFLMLNDTQIKGKAYVDYRLRIRDQLHGKHKRISGKGWFTESGWGSSGLLKLSQLNDATMGFLVEDTLIIEAEIVSISCARKVIPSS